GYGLSYTTFDISDVTVAAEGDDIVATAKVTNTGDVAGKEVVQVYFSAPQGKLSKPALSLAAFAKTRLLESGEEQELEFEIPLYTIASFDDIGKTGNKFSYILERGEYRFYAARNVRELVEAGAFTLQSNIVLQTLDEICGVRNPFERIAARVSHGKLIPIKEWVDGSQPYLKKRIEDNLPKEIGFKGAKNYRLQDVVDGKISLDDFISTLTNDELEALTRGQGYMDSELGVSGNAGAFGGVIQSLRDKGVPPVITTDGPAGIRIKCYTSLLPCGTALACTWNTELVEELCTELGRELAYRKSDVLLAPGMNIHRDPLCGRNFEYFSEDPVLTGKMAAAYVRGVQSHGAAACPKHFACNNQEVNRTHNDSRVSQRALREIYLKGFEICVKESNPLCIMTSYNKINGVWSHYNYDLAAVVLRREWGFDGLVMTDWWMRSSKSEQFPNIRDNAYRVRSQVDVLMPGGKKRIENSYKSDGTLLETVGTRNGFTRAEIERTAKCVLSVIIKLKY
ncbi:MAG: glycoside hydrolase family 3 N-terminal domain-containing protein, partial [Eubacterium sp.]